MARAGRGFPLSTGFFRVPKQQEVGGVTSTTVVTSTTASGVPSQNATGTTVITLTVAAIASGTKNSTAGFASTLETIYTSASGVAFITPILPSTDPDERGYIGLSIEPFFGAGNQPTTFVPAESGSFSDDNRYLPYLMLNRGIDVEKLLSSTYQTSGSLDMVLSPVGIIELLRAGLWGKVVTASVVPFYQHTIESGNSLVSLSIESSIADMVVVRRSGMVVDSFGIRASFGEIAKGSFSLVGTASLIQEAPQLPYYYSGNPLSFTGATVRVNDVDAADIMSVSLNVSNSIRETSLLRRSHSVSGYTLSGRDVSVNIEVEPHVATYLIRVSDKLDCSVVLLLEDGTGQSVEFVTDSLIFSSADTTVSNSPSQSIVGTAKRRELQSVMTVVVTNSEPNPV